MLVLLFLTSKDSFNLHLRLGSACPSGPIFFFFSEEFWTLLSAQLGEPILWLCVHTVRRPRDFFQKALYCLTKEHIWKSPLWGSYFSVDQSLSDQENFWLYSTLEQLEFSGQVLEEMVWRITESSVWKPLSASVFWSLPLSWLKIPDAGYSGCAVLLLCAHADTREEGCRQC